MDGHRYPRTSLRSDGRTTFNVCTASSATRSSRRSRNAGQTSRHPGGRMSRRGSKGPTDRTSCAASGRRFGWNPADRHELPSGPPVGAPGPALHGTHTSNCVARIAAATWRSAFGRTTQLAETPAEAAPPRRTACRDSVTRPPLRPRAGPTVVACARHPFTGVCYPGTASRSRRGPRPSRLRGLRAPPLALVRVHTGLMRHSGSLLLSTGRSEGVVVLGLPSGRCPA